MSTHCQSIQEDPVALLVHRSDSVHLPARFLLLVDKLFVRLANHEPDLVPWHNVPVLDTVLDGDELVRWPRRPRWVSRDKLVLVDRLEVVQPCCQFIQCEQLPFGRDLIVCADAMVNELAVEMSPGFDFDLFRTSILAGRRSDTETSVLHVIMIECLGDPTVVDIAVTLATTYTLHPLCHSCRSRPHVQTAPRPTKSSPPHAQMTLSSSRPCAGSACAQVEGYLPKSQWCSTNPARTRRREFVRCLG